MAPAASKSSSSATTLVGTELSSKYTIGKIIGQGAFGSVHEVVKINDPNNKNNKKSAALKQQKWAIKIAKVPTRGKRNSAEEEVAYQLLYWEWQIYTNLCAHLLGTHLPELPFSLKPALFNFYDNHNGYRCLVMERMASQLFDAFPELVSQYYSKKTQQSKTTKSTMIPLGPICNQLLDIVQAIHKTGLLIVDIKPENWMVAYDTSSSSSSSKKVSVSSPSQALANRIRLVDAGLFQKYLDAYGHKINDPRNDLQGTPLYASLKVHALNTPSRRDDVEALLYMIGDMVHTIHGLANDKKPPYQTCNGQDRSYLPWSIGTSDADIGRLKKEHVTNLQSMYYTTMPGDCAQILYDATNLVRGYKYKADPNYDQLREMLSSLSVPMMNSGGGGVATTAKKRAAAVSQKVQVGADTKKPPPSARATTAATSGTRTTSTTRRSSTKEQLVVDDDSDSKPSPAKKQRRIHTTSTKTAAALKDDDDVSMEDVADSIPKVRTARAATTASKKKATTTKKKKNEPEAMDVDEPPAPPPRVMKQRTTTTVKAAATAKKSQPAGRTRSSSAAAFPKSMKENNPVAALIKVTKGDNVGHEYLLEQGGVENVTIGSNPRKPRRGATSSWQVSGPGVAPEHVQLKLQCNGHVVSVKVTNLTPSTTTTTKFNGKIMDKDTRQSFRCPDTIQMGNGGVEIQINKPMY